MKNTVEMSAFINGRLNAPSVEDLVTEAEAVIYELERRMRKAEQDRQLLGVTRNKVQAVIRRTR